VIVYGRNPVREALRGGRRVSTIWATARTLREPWLAEVDARVLQEPEAQIGARCGSEAHQGICAEVQEFRYAEASGLLREGSLVVALDQIQDPQNLGAVCRSAECAGAAGVVLPDRRACEVTSAVCKASAGAVEHLPIARVRNLADFLQSARASGFWCYGASAGGAIDYRSLDWSGSIVLVLGSEGRGLRPRVAGCCDALVSLPLRGRIESLSVAAAAAALLYAALGAREPPEARPATGA
jgi:23S rRNA (guanosine2251-2'-O)-methyltransferase